MVDRRGLIGVMAAMAGWIAVGELSHALAGRRALGRPVLRSGRREAIIVLGFPSRPDGSPHPLQRWRADIAARTIRPGVETRLVCTGFALDGESEAAMLARLLRDRGVREDQIVLEERARSTWENIAFSTPFVEDADVVRIASDSLHAWRARRFLWRQRPDLALRLARAADYRLGERWWLKTASAIYEAVGAWREWRHPRLPDEGVAP